MENKYPKNVRQIGNVSDTPKIYIEDYVDTFLNQLCQNMEEEMVGVFLVGHTVRQDDQDCIYVSGALRNEVSDSENGLPVMNQEAWERARKEKEEYFSDGEMMGWCIIKKEGELRLEREWRRIHEQYFGVFGTILILKTNEDEKYFAYKYKELMEMNGHYIYYEKNAAMQNYMILERKKLGVTPSETVEDKAAQEFRSLVKERTAAREEQKSIRYMRAVCAVLVLAVLGMGVTMANNYGKMQELQVAVKNLDLPLHEREDDKNSVETSGEVEGEAKDLTEMPQELESKPEEESWPEQEEPDAETIGSTIRDMSEDIYIVEKGDTLVKISKKVYGDIGHVDAICRMNGLNDGNLIFIGQKLLLP